MELESYWVDLGFWRFVILMVIGIAITFSPTCWDALRAFRERRQNERNKQEALRVAIDFFRNDATFWREEAERLMSKYEP